MIRMDVAMDHTEQGNSATRLLRDKCLIGIDLGATNIRVARIDHGAIAELESEHIVKTDEADELIQQIETLVGKVITQGVQGIGFGVPSVVDVEKGIVYDVQNIPSWKEVPLKAIFEDRFSLPVSVNNDANCFVLGEKYFGAGREYSSIVGLVLGSGFGGGLFLDGKLYCGRHCGAGEVGMLPYKDSIFEHYCSGMFFEREFSISGDEVFRLASDGQEEALIMYEAFGVHLGNALKAVMYAYDPEIIIFGGSISAAYSYFKEPMLNTLQDFAYSNSLRDLQIEVSRLKQVAVLGAAALTLEAHKV